MAVYQRDGVYWYEFNFLGNRVRKSTHSSNKDMAFKAEREHRRRLEHGVNHTKENKRPALFSVAARDWLELNAAHWSENNQTLERYHIQHLLGHFGNMLVSDITADDISRFQAKRKKEHASPRTINMQVGTLRAILRKHRLWANIQPDVRMLKARKDIGRALTADEQHRLLTACKKSRSRSLYFAVLLSLHTGLRNSELRHMRWRQVDLLEETLTVGKSKTADGEGRSIPLSRTALLCLQEWRRQFPDAQPAHFVFPSEAYGLDGEDGYKDGKIVAFRVRPDVPIGSWKSAWTTARKEAKISCRWHDMRHSFVSAIAEGQASDATIMSLAGHVSRKMMELYSHTRNEAKRSAISALDAGMSPEQSPQNSPQ
jgi:integrase